MSENYILAVNPWIYDFTAYDLWLKPFGLLCVADYLKSFGYKIVMFDCLDRQHPALKRYQKAIPKSKKNGTGKYISEGLKTPDALNDIPRRYKRYGVPYDLVKEEFESLPSPKLILVTSLLTYWYEGVKDISKLLGETFPGVQQFLGGILPDRYPELSASLHNYSYIHRDNNMINLLKEVDQVFGKDRDYSRIDISCEKRFKPDYSLINDRASMPILTSLGCPYKCPFCITPVRWGKFRCFDADAAAGRVLELHEKYSTVNFAFYDDAFLHKPEEHFYRFAERIIRSGKQLFFHTPNGLFPGNIDGNCASYLFESGFVRPRLSYESIDPALQAAMGKVDDVKLAKAIDNLERAGYDRGEVDVYLLVGMPGQTVTEVTDGMKYINDLGARVNLAYYSPIPGTPEGDRTIDRYLENADDPLLANKFAFLQWHPRIGLEEFHKIRAMKKELNQSL